jgi:hypothetical protein
MDIQLRDENRMPVYRKYRDAQLPVYKAPPGLSAIDRRRGNYPSLELAFLIAETFGVGLEEVFQHRDDARQSKRSTKHS